MSARLGLWLLLAAAGWGFSFWVYRQRELPVASRSALATLRGASIAVALLLFLDFSLPSTSGTGGRWLLVDSSSSMEVMQGNGTPSGAVGTTTEGWDEVVYFGEGDSRLAPALTQALEAGASEIRVLSDLRLQDPVESEARLRGAQVSVSFEDLGGDVVNAGVADIEAPDVARAGATISGTLSLFGSDVEEVRVSLAGGVAAWDTLVTLDGVGNERIPFQVQAPDSAGALVLTAMVTAAGDAFGGDDRRSVVVDVDPPTGELVLASWSPDWEPRFLLPVLEEVTGLRGQGYLRVGDDRFMTMNGPAEFVDEDEMALRLSDARLSVVHGLPDDPSEAVARAVRQSPRLLLVPAGTRRGQAGEWYLSPEIPASPLAGELAGLPVLGLPPLRSVDLRESPTGTGLLLQLGGRGEAVPGLILRERSGGRVAEALAAGFWRWSMRGGAGRELYRRLWSGVSGWLLAGRDGTVREAGIAPVDRVVAPSAPMAWRAGPAAGNGLEVSFRGDDGDVSSSLAVDSLGRATGDAPSAPGIYTWEASVVGGEADGRAASGTLVVEPGDLDLLPSRAVSLAGLAPSAASGDGAGGRRPLRTHPLPYLLLLGLLSSEWFVRRRSGLR